MAKTQSNVGNKEGFLVQMNGDYNVPFDELSITAAAALPSGTVLESTSAVADAESTTVLGILAHDKPTGTQPCRVMVRGNPTTVNRQALSYGTADEDDTDALLAAKGIIVVNS